MKPEPRSTRAQAPSRYLYEVFRPGPSEATKAQLPAAPSVPETPTPAAPLPQGTDVSDDEDEFEGLTEDELRVVQDEFIIHARDNNVPNPFGTHSTATGKRTWYEVADMFKAKFKCSRAPHTLSRRYRTYFNTYCRQYPSYPRKIIYWGGPLPQSHLKKDGKKRAAPDASTNENSLVLHKKRRLDEAGGLDKLVSQPVMVTLSVFDLNGTPLGLVHVPVDDLEMSSKHFRRERPFVSVTGLVVTVPARAVAERYVQCISPRRLSRLPEFDFELINRHSGKRHIMRGICTPIEWTFDDVVELYLFASEFEDDHVTNLVLDHWWHQFKRTDQQKLEIPAEGLDALFLHSPSSSRACKFWALALIGQGLAEQIYEAEERGEWDSPIAAVLRAAARSNMRFTLDWTKAGFCYLFHQHGTEEQAKSCRSRPENHSNDQPCYSAIAKRMLSGQGWVGRSSVAMERAVTRDFRDAHHRLLDEQD